MTGYKRLSELVAAYSNTADCNDRVHREMTEATRADPVLSSHRRHVEENNLGFGDAAFHSMWRSILEAAHERFGAVEALEIGVFKGQVISLWSLISKAYNIPLQVSAVGPLEGQPMREGRLMRAIKLRLFSRFRERVKSGDFYPDENYEVIVRKLFEHFGLDFANVRLHRGYSTNSALLSGLAGCAFHLIYIDGDHTYDGACADIRNFGPKVVRGGWLVMDDAAFGFPGTTFWKGYETVTRACELLAGLGFRNVLNVGHNRVFERIS